MKHRGRSREEQAVVDVELGVPRHLRGWHVTEFEHPRGQKKARRLIRWAAEAGGPDVAAFPIDAVTLPAMSWDYAAGRNRRFRRPGMKPAAVVLLPTASREAAA